MTLPPSRIQRFPKVTVFPQPVRTLARLLFATIAIAVTAPAAAESEFQQWFTLSARTDVDDAFTLQAETVARFANGADGLYELENSALIGYKLSDQITVWAGYVYNPTYDRGSFVVAEHRARQQITIDDIARLGILTWSARLRVEHRWRDDSASAGWRARPYLKAEIPLGAGSSPVMNFTTEPFVNINSTAFQADTGIDRLRSAVSITIPLENAVSLELGYLNQHRFVRGGEDVGEHALTASLALSF